MTKQKTINERIAEIENTLSSIDYRISSVIFSHEYEILYNIPELIKDLQSQLEATKKENEELRNGLITITNMVDNQNPTHEEIWRIAHFTLEQLNKDND